ncbi:MAG: DUF3866 family protein [Coriobacteriia bacterium]|nr:DUF3866 family protein [Coriobacteriia bacterium]
MTALDLDLGTGGLAFVIPTEEMEQDLKQGHIMKLRYTPLQREVLALDEQDSPYHAIMEQAHSLDGLPVVCCALASQVPLVAAAIKTKQPQARIVLCMTDEASLMFAFSDSFQAARDTGLIDEAISCGQALGGSLEAITLHSGLLAARHVLGADACIVSIGPGTPGSATPYGHGGIAQGEAINAVAALEGLPIAALRLSFAETRKRHHGVSHHSIIALGRICLARACIPVPGDLTPEQKAEVFKTLADAGLPERHDIVELPPNASGFDLRGLKVTTMGRTQEDDPVFYSASFAAGMLAASIISQRS